MCVCLSLSHTRTNTQAHTLSHSHSHTLAADIHSTFVLVAKYLPVDPAPANDNKKGGGGVVSPLLPYFCQAELLQRHNCPPLLPLHASTVLVYRGVPQNLTTNFVRRGCFEVCGAKARSAIPGAKGMLVWTGGRQKSGGPGKRLQTESFERLLTDFWDRGSPHYDLECFPL